MRAARKPKEESIGWKEVGVLLEEVRSELKRVSEGQVQFREHVDQEFHLLRAEMNQRFEIVEQAIKENAQGIRKNREAIRENREAIREIRTELTSLRSDVTKLTERFEAHEKTHA